MTYPHGGEEGKCYYVDETTYGTTPTNPAFQWIGVIRNVEPAVDPSLIKLRGIGSRDVQYLLRGLRKLDLKIDYAMQNKTFLNKITAGWPTGSGQPMTIEVYYETPPTPTLLLSMLHTGCLLDKVTVKGSILGADPEIMVETELIAQELAVSASHPTGATYADDPGTTPKLASDVKIEIDATELTDVYDFRFSVLNNLKRYPVIRSTDGHLLKWLLGRHREFDIELTAYLTSDDYLAGLLADWEGTVKFTIGMDIYTFSGCKYASIVEPTRVQAEVPQKLQYTAKTLSIN